MGIAIARNSTCLSTMPPQRTRNLVEDSRSEASSSKEKYTSLPLSSHTISKGRRNGDTATLAGSSLKDVFNATQVTFPRHNAQDDVAKVCEAISPPSKASPSSRCLLHHQITWSSFDTSVLHAYRHAHNLDIAPAFTNSYNQRMLTRPGIGRLSPTMARPKHRRPVSKEELATAVRKDFNDAMLQETDIITSFVYAARNQGIYNLSGHFSPTYAVC